MTKVNITAKTRFQDVSLKFDFYDFSYFYWIIKDFLLNLEENNFFDNISWQTKKVSLLTRFTEPLNLNFENQNKDKTLAKIAIILVN